MSYQLCCLILCFVSLALNASHSPSPQDYGQHAIDVIKTFASNANHIDWSQYKNVANKLATINDAHLLIDNLITQLGDGHSKFETIPLNITVTRKSFNDRPQARFIAGQVAYLKILSTQAIVTDQYYVQQLSTLIMRMHKKNPIGWIIDLRDCNEPTPWRLLAGFDAFIKPSTVGYVTYADGQTEPIVMSRQHIRSDRSMLLNFASNHRHYKIDKTSMVALIVNHNTSHAGLTMAALLAHHAQARIFSPNLDEQECSFVSSHQLADHAYLHLVEGQWQSMQQQPLIFKVDETIHCNENKTDDALNAAIDWMLTTIEQQIEKAEPDPFKD